MEKKCTDDRSVGRCKQTQICKKTFGNSAQAERGAKNERLFHSLLGKQCDQIGDLLDFGHLFIAFSSN